VMNSSGQEGHFRFVTQWLMDRKVFFPVRQAGTSPTVREGSYAADL